LEYSGESIVFCAVMTPCTAHKGAERMDRGTGELAREGPGRVRYISAGRVFDNRGGCVTIEHNVLGQKDLRDVSNGDGMIILSMG
jgi:hypothetical protein